MNEMAENEFKSTKNKKPQYSDYLNNSLYLFDFDTVKEYTNYFSHNNVSLVVSKEKINNLLRMPKSMLASLKKAGSNIANTSFSTKKRSSIKTIKNSEKIDKITND